MKTNALLTDLTPEQEEKLSGGILPIVLGYWAFCAVAGGLYGWSRATRR